MFCKYTFISILSVSPVAYPRKAQQRRPWWCCWHRGQLPGPVQPPPWKTTPNTQLLRLPGNPPPSPGPAEKHKMQREHGNKRDRQSGVPSAVILIIFFIYWTFNHVWLPVLVPDCCTPWSIVYRGRPFGLCWPTVKGRHHNNNNVSNWLAG